MDLLVQFEGHKSEIVQLELLAGILIKGKSAPN